MIITRFMPILRTFAPIVGGIGQMSYKKFTYYNIIGAYWMDNKHDINRFFLGRTIPNIDKHIEKVIIVVVFLSLLPAIIKYLKHKFSSKKQRKKFKIKKIYIYL